MIEELHGESLIVGLKRNMKKTKVVFDYELGEQQIMIGSETLLSVNKYTHI